MHALHAQGLQARHPCVQGLSNVAAMHTHTHTAGGLLLLAGSCIDAHTAAAASSSTTADQLAVPPWSC